MANMAKDKSFSATEVGVLVERLESKIDVVAERVGGLCEDMTEVKERLTSLETRMITVEDAIRITLPDHSRRLAKLEAKAGL